MEESKEELEINMKFATRCLISSLNIEFLTSIGKPKRLYTPRSAKSSREFTNNIIHEELHEEPEIYNEDIINNENEITGKNENRFINGDRSKETAELNNTLNSIDDRFKDKNFDKECKEENNYRHSTLNKSERVYIPLNDIKDSDNEDDEAQDVVGDLKCNDGCVPFPSLNHITPEEPKNPPNTPNDDNDTIPFPSNNTSSNDSIPETIPKIPEEKTEEDFPSMNSDSNSKPPLANNGARTRQKSCDVGLQRKLSGRKGRRRSISSPPPPFPDLNSALNVSSNDDSENEVLCHLRDIDVQITYLKGYSTYTVNIIL